MLQVHRDGGTPCLQRPRHHRNKTKPLGIIWLLPVCEEEAAEFSWDAHDVHQEDVEIEIPCKARDRKPQTVAHHGQNKPE